MLGPKIKLKRNATTKDRESIFPAEFSKQDRQNTFPAEFYKFRMRVRRRCTTESNDRAFITRSGPWQVFVVIFILGH